MKEYRCDQPMKRSKLASLRYMRADDARKFRCRRDCSACICGMVKLKDGTWEHVQLDK